MAFWPSQSSHYHRYTNLTSLTSPLSGHVERQRGYCYYYIPKSAICQSFFGEDLVKIQNIPATCASMPFSAIGPTVLKAVAVTYQTLPLMSVNR